MNYIGRKRWYVLAIALLFMSVAAFADVSVSSPAPGSIDDSPVHFVASASSSSPITAMQIYVDNNSVFLVNAASIDTSVAMSTGTHSVVVQAWDSAGGIFKTPLTITVFAGVSVSFPAPGSTDASPVHFVASASSSSPITAMQIYVDNNSVFLVNAASIDTSVAMSTGTHSVVVQAWDSAGGIFKTPLTITVNSSSTPVPGAIVKDQIQQMTGWESCTTCAGAGASGPVAAFSMTQFQASPSLSGKSANFWIGGSVPYSSALWWKQLDGNNGITHFQYDLDFYSTAPQYAQALEFDVNQTISNRKFIFGTQCNIKDGGVWDVWDTAGGAWSHTGIGCGVPAAYQWHHLTWELYRDASATHFVAVTLDGVKHYVNFAYQGKPQSGTEINVAFQMDGDYAQHAYNVWLDNVTLRYW